MYSLSSEETIADVVWVSKDFESIFGDISKVETITIDTALMKAEREVFLWVNVLLYCFHNKQPVTQRVRLL